MRGGEIRSSWWRRSIVMLIGVPGGTVHSLLLLWLLSTIASSGAIIERRPEAP
jgi:hypothetical protein